MIPPFNCRWIQVCLLAGCLTAGSAAQRKDAQEADVAVVPVHAWKNVFGETETEYLLRVVAKREFRGRAVWSFRIGNATAASREVEVAASPDKAAALAFKVLVPPVKDGVILAAKLAVNVFEGDKPEPAATFTRDVWIFPKDPFVDKGEWLKGLKLRLYDPPQTTAKALAALNVPFEDFQNMAALADFTDGVLIVGEGVSLKEEAGLSELMAARAASGVRVLCLAPSSGDLIVPGLSGPAAGFKNVAFRHDVIPTLDKRLDAEGWPPNGKTIAATLTVKAEANSVAAEIGVNGDGWPWVQSRSSKGVGSWTFCGYSLLANWDAGPTPRYMFARILSHLIDSKFPYEENEK